MFVSYSSTLVFFFLSLSPSSVCLSLPLSLCLSRFAVFPEPWLMRYVAGVQFSSNCKRLRRLNSVCACACVCAHICVVWVWVTVLWFLTAWTCWNSQCPDFEFDVLCTCVCLCVCAWKFPSVSHPQTLERRYQGILSGLMLDLMKVKQL